MANGEQGIITLIAKLVVFRFDAEPKDIAGIRTKKMQRKRKWKRKMKFIERIAKMSKKRMHPYEQMFLMAAGFDFPRGQGAYGPRLCCGP